MTDSFLDGRVKVWQPEFGLRSGLDAVMLAAAVPARSGQSALELGTGVGTASLCLLARVSDLAVTGIEIDPELAAMAQVNATENSVAARFLAGDIFVLPIELKRDFDHVFCNPPFHFESQASPDPVR